MPLEPFTFQLSAPRWSVWSRRPPSPPGFAVSTALSGHVRGRIVAIVSEGNIDLSVFPSLVGASEKSR